jgi:hypothetical protein
LNSRFAIKHSGFIANWKRGDKVEKNQLIKDVTIRHIWEAKKRIAPIITKTQ